jgi:hypothetical protein
MIRRDLRLPDGSAGWMLISQPEHARISFELARRCRGRFGPEAGPRQSENADQAGAVRQEVLAAIRCHDDGWAEWERAPRLDARLGRPLSFMELEPAESVAIWSSSIATAEAHGPLAGWLVSGHFLRLLNNSDEAHRNQVAVQWREEMEARRGAWLAAWQAIDPASRARALADEALQWLWTFDEVSLWFCCICPNQEGDARTDGHATIAGKATPIVMALQSTARESPARAAAQPYRFDLEPIDIEAEGLVVPAVQYADCNQMFAAAERKSIHWRLQSKIA